jgi:hypothetical protein
LHWAALEADGCDALTYVNHEGAPEAEAIGDYFKEVPPQPPKKDTNLGRLKMTLFLFLKRGF